jgi:hypothetical protein
VLLGFRAAGFLAAPFLALGDFFGAAFLAAGFLAAGFLAAAVLALGDVLGVSFLAVADLLVAFAMIELLFVCSMDTEMVHRFAPGIREEQSLLVTIYLKHSPGGKVSGLDFFRTVSAVTHRARDVY